MPDPAGPPSRGAEPPGAAGSAAPPEDVEAVAAAVTSHPAVARLDGGPFDTVASYLPGRRRLIGVRIGGPRQPTRVAVVVRPGVALPRLAAELAALVRTVLGPVPVEVTFADVEAGGAAGAEPGPVPG